MPNTFLVKAFRYGWHNEHQYDVYCGPDKKTAFGLAEEEIQELNGRYGMMVIEYDESGEHHVNVEYYPSCRGEPSLQHNWFDEKRIDVQNLLDKFLLKTITEGQLRDEVAKLNGLYIQLMETEINKTRAN